MLERLLTYNLWANERLVDNIRSVDPVKGASVALAPFGSIHDALRHVIGAEMIWRERVEGSSPSDFMGITDGKTTDELLADLVRASQGWLDLARTRPDILASSITYATTKGDPFTQSVADIVMHVVNHSTYHRGQIMSALRSVHDGRLGGLDLILYVRSTNVPGTL